MLLDFLSCSGCFSQAACGEMSGISSMLINLMMGVLLLFVALGCHTCQSSPGEHFLQWLLANSQLVQRPGSSAVMHGERTPAVHSSQRAPDDARRSYRELVISPLHMLILPRPRCCHYRVQTITCRLSGQSVGLQTPLSSLVKYSVGMGCAGGGGGNGGSPGGSGGEHAPAHSRPD